MYWKGYGIEHHALDLGKFVIKVEMSVLTMCNCMYVHK